MDEFVSNNKFLRVPRLVNQQLFDELCPVKQFHRRRKYDRSRRHAGPRGRLRCDL